MVVLSNYYFGSVQYFKELLNYETLYLDAHENYQKQTYRNRCYILGANGPLRLAIPILHNGKRSVKELEISYDFNWQKEHIKSLQSAYQSAPYFEYYEDEIVEIINTKEKYLWDLNIKTFEFINKKLHLNLNYTNTETYIKNPKIDLRNQFNAKKREEIELEPYSQVFQEKFGFTSNLSILDLLCNEGPNSVTYLKENNLKSII